MAGSRYCSYSKSIDVSGHCYFASMNDEEKDFDDDGSGMSEGDIHSGPGGYEGMGYEGGYAADYREKQDQEDEDNEDDENDDFDEDEANRY
ncbi:MAG: hypothetical protein RL683_141 [Actinomycetota bacterium]